MARADQYSNEKIKTKVSITDRDIAILLALHYHGGRLTTGRIYELTKHIFSNYEAMRTRLRHLKGHYIVRPFQQKNTLDPRKNELIHEINDAGEDLLKERGLFCENAPTRKRKDLEFFHEVMNSCLSADFCIESEDAEFTYHPQAESDIKPTFDLNGEEVTPDDYFYFHQPDKMLHLFLETDRGTEPIQSKSLKRKSITKMVQQYKKIIGQGVYKSHYKVGRGHGALLLIATTTVARANSILKIISKEFPNGCEYILVRAFPEFGQEFKPPKALHVLDRYWERAGKEPFKFI